MLDPVKEIRFASFTWLILIPIFAILKVIGIFYTPKVSPLLIKPIPAHWLDTISPLNIFISIALIVVASYFIFAYINAFIHLQTTYTIPLFFAILALLSFTPELSSSLLAILLFMIGILPLFSLDEKKKTAFIVFDTGFFLGLAILFECYLILIALTLPVFLFLLHFSFRQFLQYWAGILLPFLFAFPILYFTDALSDWLRYLSQLLIPLNTVPQIAISDYILIGILIFLCTLQALVIYKRLKKHTERRLLSFLLIYFAISLIIGIFAYPYSRTYLLYTIPSMTILYSLSRHQNQRVPVFIVLCTILYFIWQIVL